jgi:hypothetical protein
MTSISYTNIANKESGLSARNKINLLGSSVASMSSELISELNIINGSLVSLDTRVDTLEVVKSLLAAGTNTELAPQSVSDTPTKLIFMSSEQLKCGTKFTSNVLNNSITIGSNVVASIGGSVTIKASTGNLVSVEMYVNGIATGSINSMEAQGTSKPISLTYYGVANFNAADVITLYVSSTGSSIQITKSSFVLEEKGC